MKICVLLISILSHRWGSQFSRGRRFPCKVTKEISSNSVPRGKFACNMSGMKRTKHHRTSKSLSGHGIELRTYNPPLRSVHSSHPGNARSFPCSTAVAIWAPTRLCNAFAASQEEERWRSEFGSPVARFLLPQEEALLLLHRSRI